MAYLLPINREARDRDLLQRRQSSEPIKTSKRCNIVIAGRVERVSARNGEFWFYY